MDARRFDRLARALTEAGTRRGLLGILCALPLLGGFLAVLDPDDAEARGRRRRRKKSHKHGKGKGRHRKGKRKCKAHPKTRTCAGKCGKIKNNCKKTIDCGACACGQACSGDTPVCWNDACVCGDVCASGCQFTSVQAAITAASAGSTIVICPGTFATNAATLDKDLTLVGAGMGLDPSTDTILDGGQTSGVLVVNEGVTATLRALTITRGRAEWGGGIDHLGGTLDLDTVLVTDNEATAGGSGIVSVGALTLTDSIVSLNGGEELGGGGGVYISFAGNTLTLVRSVVEENTAPIGGGIQNFQAIVNLTDNSHFRDNSADGLRNDGGTVNVSGGSTFANNTPNDCIDVNGGTGCPT
jgi:hypothetical protein